MASQGQKQGACGHVMATFNQRSGCACCRVKGQGSDPCVNKQDCESCNMRDSLIADQITQLSTPTNKARKEKKNIAATPSLVDAGSVWIVGQVDTPGQVVEKEVQHLPDKKTECTSSIDKKKDSSKT